MLTVAEEEERSVFVIERLKLDIPCVDDTELDDAVSIITPSWHIESGCVSVESRQTNK